MKLIILLFGATAVTVTTQLLGELVVNSLFLDVIFPYFGRAGGDCEFYQTLAISTCTCSIFTIILFLIAVATFFTLNRKVSIFLAFCATASDSSVLLCAILLYGRVPDSENGVRKDLECMWTPALLNDWSEHWHRKLQGHDNVESVLEQRACPWDAHLALLIISCFAIGMIGVMLIVSICMFGCLFEQSPAKVSGNG
jgi:hypothetical protein